MQKNDKTAPSIIIQVKGGATDVPPALFSNFLGISRVAADVQLEFVFLDLNRMVEILNEGQKDRDPIMGQTVAKIIMPAAAFVQLKDHLAKLMKDIEKEMTQAGGGQNANDRQATRP